MFYFVLGFCIVIVSFSVVEWLGASISKLRAETENIRGNKE